MKHYIRIAAIVSSLAGLVALTFAQTPTPARLLKARLIKQIPELVYYDGQVGIEFRIGNLSGTTIGDRQLVVEDLDPSTPKLLGGVTDDRAPLSGYLNMNGTIVHLSRQPNGLLAATIPQSSFNWYSANVLSVEVFDESPAMGTSPAGASILRWETRVNSLL